MAAYTGYLKVFFCVLFVACWADSTTPCRHPECVYITLNESQAEPFEIAVKAPFKDKKKLFVLCYPGQKKMWYRLWVNPKLTIQTTDFKTLPSFYYGQNLTEVVEKATSNSFFMWPSFMPLKTEHAFDPFNVSCIGISSLENYTVYFVIRNPEFRYVAYTVIGLLVFFLAPSLSRNTFLHYGTGVSVGILGSVLLAVFIISRFLPEKLRTLGYVIAAVSTSASMYLFQWLSDSFSEIINTHWQILIGYVLVTGLLSFAIVYKYGPVSNQRTLNLVKWTLQLIGMIMVYQGTQIADASVAIIIVALVIYIFPPGLLRLLKKLRFRYFPPKTRLMTEEEFYAEGEVETRNALEELRKFCTSPECNAWRTISRLSSPSKFAGFIEGRSHLSDMELDEYDATADVYPLRVEDDSESESEMYYMRR